MENFALDFGSSWRVEVVNFRFFFPYVSSIILYKLIARDPKMSKYFGVFFRYTLTDFMRITIL